MRIKQYPPHTPVSPCTCTICKCFQVCEFCISLPFLPQRPALHVNIHRSLWGEGSAAKGLSPKLIYASAHYGFILWWLRIWSLRFSRMAPNFHVLLFLSLSSGQLSNPASLSKGHLGQEILCIFHEGKYTGPSHAAHLCRQCFRSSGCLWAGIHSSEKLSVLSLPLQWSCLFWAFAGCPLLCCLSCFVLRGAFSTGGAFRCSVWGLNPAERCSSSPLLLNYSSPIHTVGEDEACSRMNFKNRAVLLCLEALGF